MMNTKTGVKATEFDWSANNMEHRMLTCVNHPTGLWMTKHLGQRTLHIMEYPQGMAGECSCPLADLIVIESGRGFQRR